MDDRNGDPQAAIEAALFLLVAEACMSDEDLRTYTVQRMDGPDAVVLVAVSDLGRRAVEVLLSYTKPALRKSAAGPPPRVM